MKEKVLAWYHRFWWAFWLVFAGAAGLLVWCLRHLFMGTSAEDRARYQMPAVPSAVQQRVEASQEQAHTAIIQANTRAEDKIQQLEEIQKIPDGPLPSGEDGGAERRRRLAGLLSTLK